MSFMQTASRDSLDMESEMMPQDPPPWIIRFTARFLIVTFFAVLIASVLIHLPESVECTFVLIPKSGADPIQAPRQATISRVSVVEGQTVTAGTELFVLRSDEIRGWHTELGTLSADLRSREEGLAKADAAYLSQLEIKLQEIAQADSELKFREKHTNSNKDLLARMDKLSQSGGISQVELIKLRLDVAESEKDHSVAQRTVQQLTLEREQMENEHQRKRSEEVAEIEKLKLRLAGLRSNLENSEQNLLSIRAPYNGVIVSVAQRSPGSVVQNGQELCQLAPGEARPQARLTLHESSLAKLQVGQKVRLFFDAFPYQRYGAVNTNLDWISPSAVTTPDSSHFVALTTLDNAVYSRGEVLPLRVGMKGEAHITVGRRALIEYAFEPLKQLRESMR